MPQLRRGVHPTAGETGTVVVEVSAFQQTGIQTRRLCLAAVDDPGRMTASVFAIRGALIGGGTRPDIVLQPRIIIKSGNNMANTVFEPNPIPALPVKDSDRVFPVHRVYCIGRNYADHAIEMGHDPDKEPPFFFQKNPDNLLTGGADFPYPPETGDVHHEIELVVALNKGGSRIDVENALDCVFGYGVALDMTRRDLQGQAKKMGRPWEVGKAFEHSAPCTHLVPAVDAGHPEHGAIWLKVNGETRQQGDLNQMIWKIPEMIACLSVFFELRPGDVILTGTPAGVGPVQRGDYLEGCVQNVATLQVKVV